MKITVYIIHDKDKCKCKTSKMDAFVRTIPKESNTWPRYNKKGEELLDPWGYYFFDRHGFRSQIPGECRDCYWKYVEDYREGRK